MGHSVHTRPRRILAFDRSSAPFARRGVAGVNRRYRLWRRAKECGASASYMASRGDDGRAFRMPRVNATRAPRGWYYPADRSDIVRLLRFFGPEVTYGLRSIDLIPAPDSSNRLRLGALVVPGQIKLYALRPSPWVLVGTVSNSEHQRLTRAGAVVADVGGGLQTTVAWPGDMLRDFVLFDVLMHEIGHHIVQQYTGKRTGRVMRTRDHEVFADRFARRCRREFARS